MTTEKVKDESEQLRNETYDFYARSYRTWLEGVNSWTRMAEGMSGTPYRMDMESWFRPYWDYMQRWGSLVGNYSNMLARTWMPPSSPLRTFSDITSRWANAYIRIYDTWFRNMSGVFRESLEISRKLNAREEVDIDRFMDLLRNTYDNISNTIVDVSKDTPIAGIKEVNEAVNKSLDSFPEQQDIAKDFLRESLNLNVRLMDLSALTLRQLSETASNLGKGTLSEDGYTQLVDAYTDTLQRFYKHLNIPAARQIEPKQLKEDTNNWVKSSIQLYLSWLDMSYKMYQGVTNSAFDVYKISSETPGEGKTPSAEEYAQGWTDAYWRSLDSIAKGSRFFETVPRWINSYSNWVTATYKLYQTLTVPPFSTKEDIDIVWREVDRLRKAVERPKTEARSKTAQHKANTGVRRATRA